MNETLDAIYENGVLRLLKPVELEEGARVTIALEINIANQDNELRDVVQQNATEPKSPQEILAFFQEMEALPIEGKTDEFSGSDHDKLLYGNSSAV